MDSQARHLFMSRRKHIPTCLFQGCFLFSEFIQSWPNQGYSLYFKYFAKFCCVSHRIICVFYFVSVCFFRVDNNFLWKFRCENIFTLMETLCGKHPYIYMHMYMHMFVGKKRVGINSNYIQPTPEKVVTENLQTKSGWVKNKMKNSSKLDLMIVAFRTSAH